MADAAVGFLLDNLDNLEQLMSDRNTSISADFLSHVKSLKTYLEVFRGFIKYSSEQRIRTETGKAIVNSISNVIYTIEDAIDRLVVETARFKESSFSIRAFTRSTMIWRVTQEIQHLITVEVKQIYDIMLLEWTPENYVYDKKPHVVEEKAVVGFDEEAETIIKRLLNEVHLELDIVTIIGIPGLGKTTLARKIYNDPAIQHAFFTRAWVNISRKYSLREVCISILKIIKPETDYKDKSDVFLVEHIRIFLERMKYIIVLDDVWTSEAWNDFKNAFPKNKRGSRILITSRHEDVARYANPNKDPHWLKSLTLEQSWELLETRVFGKQKCPLGEIQTIGKEIAAKCEGLPHQIVMIAGILLTDRESVDWWKQISKEKQFMDVIFMSYNDLPYHLKSCFLYLGVFPEDYEIPVWKLIRLWIAEGFIEIDEEKSLEEIAGQYLTDLVNKNLLIATKSRSNGGKIKTCRVHDLLYDFCKNEAARQQFYREVQDGLAPENFPRVCIDSNILEYITSKPHGQRVRSFLCFPPDEITLPRKHIDTLLRAFELLRVLDITSIVLSIFPKRLCGLVLLRYLAISCNIRALPSIIFKLLNLQTLILITTGPTLKFREEIWKMYQLRHLHTNASAMLPSPPSRTLNNNRTIQTLSTVSPESCTEHVLRRTPNIKKLGVKGKLVLLFDHLFDNVGSLQHLTNLKLYNDCENSQGKLLNLPLASKFPKCLNKLTLSGTRLNWEQMQILGNLEKLEVLMLKNNAFKGEIWQPKDGGFISLKFLHIHTTDLVNWKATKHHFPSLKHLVLEQCENLVEVPLGFAQITSLEVLELYYPNPRAAPSARRIQHKKMVKAAIETKTRGNFKLTIHPPYE